jgi:hypothetical protein|tara:strand:- start:1874 stop:2215 length:342 start_codon:yes stop_codon:yes gene_type:complete
MKTLVFASLLLVGCHAVSAPYVEFKSKAKVTSDSYAVSYFTNDAVNHIRLGNTWKNIYFEGGKMTNGVSTEAGYKFKNLGGSNFTLKGKVESTKLDAGQWKHGVETELRYTFD